jgi:hypothetical protein
MRLMHKEYSSYKYAKILQISLMSNDESLSQADPFSSCVCTKPCLTFSQFLDVVVDNEGNHYSIEEIP